jgi:hypothetical protein
LSPGAGAVLDLQRAAGNRAVAGMLAATASGVHAEPESPLTVQRDKLDKSLQKMWDQGNVDYDEFADIIITKVIKKAEASPEEKETEGEAEGETGTATGQRMLTYAERKKAAEAAIPTAAELAERETKLTKSLSADEIQRQLKGKKLDLLEEQKKIEQRITKLQKGLTPEELALRDQREHLEDLEGQQKKAEEARIAERKRKFEESMRKPLNPKKKGLGSLLGGRSF